MSGARRVVVVGGGVVGVACAHYLRRTGADVTLIDKGAVGGACSHGNCGYVCPSHVLPLAGPGVIRRTLWALLDRNGPLRIRLTAGPALWGWLWRFARRCNARDMMESARGIQALLGSSRALYDELFTHEPLEAEWQERGLLFVFRTPGEMGHYAETDRLLRERFDMPARRYDGRELVELEPALKPGLAGAWHYPLDAHLRPDRLMTSWRALLIERGVAVRENCAFLGLEREGGQARGVRTSLGALAADAVVFATGAWSPQMSEHLGCRVPIQPGKGYSLTMARPAKCPTIPMIFEEDRVAVTPFASGYRIGSTMELGGYDATLNRKRLELLRRAARLYLHEPEAEPVQEEWWGWRPMIPDGMPAIGRSPALGNVYLAAGHGMLGLSMAPGTGKLIAEMVAGAPPHIDPAPYALTRF